MTVVSYPAIIPVFPAVMPAFAGMTVGNDEENDEAGLLFVLSYAVASMCFMSSLCGIMSLKEVNKYPNFIGRAAKNEAAEAILILTANAT